MYHDSAHIYLVGFGANQATAIKEVPAVSSTSLTFSDAPSFDAREADRANAIFLQVGLDDSADVVRRVLDAKAPRTQVVLIAPHGVLDALGNAKDQLSDVWFGPLDSQELAFRFSQWLRQRALANDLWEARQFWDATIDSIPSLVWYKTKDGIHEKVNASFCDTVNKTKDQVQGQGHAYIWDVEEDDPACIESENTVMSTQQTCVAEETVQTGDGTRLLTTYKSPLYDLDGSVMGTVGVGIDTTQERAYQNDLLEKSRSLETMFTTLDCGILTHSMDGSRILGVNRTALDILGFDSEEELMSHGFDMIASTVVQEDRARLIEQISTLEEVGDSISTEYGVRHEDGKYIHVMGNIKVIEKDGEKFYQRFLLDITEQKAHQEQEERRVRNLIQALSRDYIVVCSFDLNTGEGEVLRIGTAEGDVVSRIFSDEVTLEGTIGNYIEERVLEEDRAMFRDSLLTEGIRRELAAKDRFDKLYRANKDGKALYRQVTVVRAGGWSDKDDRHEVVMGFRNVDQQIREELEQKTLLEEALSNANRANAAKSSFLLNMSHDIRTPMNAILGFTTLATNHLGQPRKVEEYLSKIKGSSDHLLNLINDILDMSRIEQGKVTLDEDVCSIVEVFDDLDSMLKQEAESKGLKLVVDTSGIQHTEVVCDRLKVNQVLLNLLGNSIKFTPAGGEVRATADELPSAPAGYGQYRFVVQDTGIGMAKDFLQYIFDPFERERTQTISGIQGSGLGMAIVKNLIEMMNGSIEVESEPDVGTTFTVDIMLKLADSSSLDAFNKEHEAVTFTPERASKYRVLLVDDNMMNREIANDLLTDAGFKVEMAVDGQDALDKLQEVGAGYFDIVLMDIQMPVMNGYQAAQAIRALDDKQLASIPILAVTADAFDEDRDRALECGMNGHLPKPIEIGKLFGLLDALLSE